jgi:DNA-directed RNA polymerase sigma subunit (sigma70/sigma32)
VHDEKIQRDPEAQFFTENSDEWEVEDGFDMEEFQMEVDPVLEEEELYKTGLEFTSEELAYRHIGRSHTTLHKRDQVRIGRELLALLKDYAYEALHTNEIREYIYDMYLDRRYAGRLNKKPKSIAKMGRNYNSSQRGKNVAVVAHIVRHMDKAVEIESEQATLVAGWESDLVRDSVFGLIIGAELSPELWTSPAIVKILEEQCAERALGLLEEIRIRRETLVKGVLKMVTNQAVKQTQQQLKGDVTTVGDAQQHGLMAAYRQTLFYDPDKSTQEGKPVKFSSYCWFFVEREINHFLAMTTRTVSVPRTTLDRYRTIRNVMDEYEISDPYKVALLCNKSVVRSRGKIKPREIFTEEEVDKVLQTIDPATISMNTTYANEEGGATPRPLIEAMPGERQTEIEVALKEEHQGFLNKTKEILSDDEYRAWALYMGLDDGSGKRPVAEAYKLWPGRISRAGFGKLLETAKARLRVHRREFKEHFFNVFEIMDEIG